LAQIRYNFSIGIFTFLVRVNDHKKRYSYQRENKPPKAQQRQIFTHLMDLKPIARSLSAMVGSVLGGSRTFSPRASNACLVTSPPGGLALVGVSSAFRSWARIPLF
jgi:hypothetical protein